MARLEKLPTNGLYSQINGEPQKKPLATIGIVDDVDAVVAGLAMNFSGEGYRVQGFVVNANVYPITDLQEQAFSEQIAQSGVQLAIVDVGLGYVSGTNVALRLKQAGIPTILLTGIRKNSELAGSADKILLKPIDFDELIEDCNRMLGIQRDVEVKGSN